MASAKLQTILEKHKGEFWGRIEGFPEFLPVTQGKDVGEVLQNLRTLIADHIANEGKKSRFWKKVDPATVDLEIHYDLQTFFDEYNALNISAVAALAGLNESLVRQYAKGIKHPSAVQAKKVEAAIHDLGKKMSRVSLVASQA